MTWYYNCTAADMLLARYQDPVDLADLAPLPDFRLVPRDLEEQVCQWDKLREYSPQVTNNSYWFTIRPFLKI